MNNITQTEYFISINALKRALDYLINYSIKIPNSIQNFINELTPNNIQKPTDFETLKYFIEQQITEHEDDGFPQSLYFEFLLIVVLLLDFYDNNEVDNLIEIQELVIGFYITQYANEYMINNGKEYYIFSDYENEMIENNPLVIQEQNAQEKDRAFICQNG